MLAGLEYAHRRGLKTLLLDKCRFPRDKVCGDAPNKIPLGEVAGAWQP